MTKTNREVAEHMLDLALTNYDRDGEVLPAFITIDGERDFSVGVAYENIDVPPLMATVLSGFINVMRPKQACIVFEAWGRSYSPEEENVARHVERGELQREAAAGDPKVHTVISVMAFSVPWGDPWWGMIDVDVPNREPIFHSPPEGRVADLMEEACATIELAPMVGIDGLAAAGAGLVDLRHQPG